jgi:polar amino acid transport system substrate-binding protein
MALQEGKVDAIIGEEPVVMNFIGELKIQDEINILSQPLYERDIRIGIKKTDKDLLTILNKGILSLKKKEFVQKIQQKWFGISAPIHKESVSVVTLISLTVVTSILIIIGLWNYFLNTEVKKQTVELNKSRNDLQMTIDAMTDYLVVVDEKGIVINVNKAYITWLNKTREDVIGKYYKELFILDSVNMNLNIKEKSRKEIIYKGMYYNFYTRPLEYEDNWMLIVIEDITDQKISQQQMLQQNKMIAVGQLAAGIAHEIRNPLGLIRNYCYILKGKINLEDVLIGKSINIIESSVLRAGKMVDNLLNFSRIGDDEFNIINLKETITDIISLESKLISKNNIEIIINCDENIMFNTKVESLNHIFLNLLSNAIDAVKDYGIINIDCAVDNNYLYIDFKDNGNGIEEENLEHVFNPFFTTKKVGKGVGLGLYIVYSEVHKLNGEIHVESQAGNKTVFKLKFPLMEDIING